MTKILQYEAREIFSGNKKVPAWGASPDRSGYSPVDEFGEYVIMNLHNRRLDYAMYPGRRDEFGNQSRSTVSFTGAKIDISPTIPNLGADDFTIDFVFSHASQYVDAETAYLSSSTILALFGIASSIDMVNNAYGFGWFSKGPIYFFLYDKNDRYRPLVIENWNLGYNAITYGRRGSNFYVYHNGNLIQHVVDDLFGEMRDFVTPARILCEEDISTFGTGYYGLRITKGYCRVDGSPKSYTMSFGWNWPSAPPARCYSENAVVSAVIDQVCAGQSFNLPASSGNFDYEIHRSGVVFLDFSIEEIIRFDRLNNYAVSLASLTKKARTEATGDWIQNNGTVVGGVYGASYSYRYAQDLFAISVFFVIKVPSDYIGADHWVFGVGPNYDAIPYQHTRTYFSIFFSGSNLKVITYLRYAGDVTITNTYTVPFSFSADMIVSMYVRYSGNIISVIINNEEFSFSINNPHIYSVGIGPNTYFIADVATSYTYAQCKAHYAYLYNRFNLGV